MAIPAAAYMQIAADAQAGKIDGQKKAPPTYWIEVTSGMRGFFAVMLWDGMGFAEPWETGMGSYDTAEKAAVEARMWAEAEGVEFRP
jgi:hypothetical protein